jgi:hypothetical protein
VLKKLLLPKQLFMHLKNLILYSSFCIPAALQAQAQDSLLREAAKTEIYEPIPPVVTPIDVFLAPPPDAIVLLGNEGLDAWRSTNDTTKAAGWYFENGVMTVNKKKGNIETKQCFMDYQLHLEWRIPDNITGSGQVRGNSGLFLASTGSGDKGYEIQILDNYNNTTYVNGQVGAVYKQHVPLANACKKPGEWQSYDVFWKAPKFNSDGSLASAAMVTVMHNGILIQNNVILQGETQWIGQPVYKAHGASPVKLQSHGDPSEPISFRNIWIRPL